MDFKDYVSVFYNENVRRNPKNFDSRMTVSSRIFHSILIFPIQPKLKLLSWPKSDTKPAHMRTIQE